jgi:methylated-DNA-[protein]-cysteine S-methyltransferase
MQPFWQPCFGPAGDSWKPGIPVEAVLGSVVNDRSFSPLLAIPAMILPMLLWHYELTIPLGSMWAAFDERGRLKRLKFGSLDPRATMPLAPKSQREVYRYLIRQLGAYFGGTLRTFTVPLDPVGTEFQMRVWDEVAAIPYGKTLELDELVRRLGGEEARQDVEAALEDNPIEILLPTHRVLGPEGAFPGSGSAIQKALLTHESGPEVRD